MLQESRVTFYFNVFKKVCSEESFLKSFPLLIIELNIYLSEEHSIKRIDCFQNNVFDELRTAMFFIAFKAWITINDRVE